MFIGSGGRGGGVFLVGVLYNPHLSQLVLPIFNVNCRSSSQLEFTLELLNYDVPDWKIALVKSKHYEGKHAEMR